MNYILNLVNGKKTSIVAILLAVIVFTVSRGYIESDLADLLTFVIVTLAGSANYANHRSKIDSTNKIFSK